MNFATEKKDSSSPITTLFLDIGGVLLTNGWDRTMRKRAAETFGLDFDEMNDRHHQVFDAYEQGKMSLDEYLRRAVFYQDRSFSQEKFRRFMFEQSQPYQEMIDLIKELKTHYDLKTIAVSNEGRELTIFRVSTFRLAEFIDFFVSSCFVHFRKPDKDIYRIALDGSQASPERVAYIEDRAMFIDVAQDLGIHGIHHKGYESTQKALKLLGLFTKQKR